MAVLASWVLQHLLHRGKGFERRRLLRQQPRRECRSYDNQRVYGNLHAKLTP
jgi:hypothetical protein